VPRRKLTDEKSIRARRSRTKGHDFERLVAIQFREVYPDARRHLEYHRMDATGIDLINTGPYKVQCKKYQKYAPLSCIEEVQCNRDKGHIPVLVTAGDGLEPLAALPLSEFLRLIAIADLIG
jgi:transposase